MDEQEWEALPWWRQNQLMDGLFTHLKEVANLTANALTQGFNGSTGGSSNSGSERDFGPVDGDIADVIPIDRA